jgi:diacylglycerol O-acyltransferase
MSRVSLIDTGFLLTETQHSPKHVACLQVFSLPKGKGSAWLRRLLDDLKQAEPGFPFSHRLAPGLTLPPKLVADSELEMDYHVRHTVLPSPGTDAQLWEAISRLHANLLDRERPLWEFHLVEGLAGRRFAFYTKLHHVLADGMTMNRWFTEAGSTSADDADTPPIWHGDRRPERPAGGEPSYTRLMLEGIRLLGGGVKTAIDLAALNTRLLQRRFLRKDRDILLPLSAPRTRLNVVPGAARSLCATAFPLETIHAIAQAQEVSINDVLLTVCDLAVHRYFADKHEPLEEPLVVYMPVNLRGSAEGEGGNLISLIQVRLAADHSDPVDVMHRIRASSRSAREVFAGYGTPAIQLYSLSVAMIAQLEESLKLGSFLPPVNNLVVSNVPGPPRTMYFRGAVCEAAYPISALAPMTALNVTANSYGGTLHIGLVSGRTAIPDLQELARHMNEAVDELENLA